MQNNVDPCKPQFYYTKVGFKGGGSKLYRYVFKTSAQGRVRTWQLDQQLSIETNGYTSMGGIFWQIVFSAF